MAEFKQHLNIANFICKFGDKVLLDLCSEVVIPAFTGGHKRGYGESQYFFYEVEVIDYSQDGAPELAIAGRFVKTTTVAREQIFVDGQIVKNHRQMASAPTSFFVLLLSNHKLLYIREHSGSPLLSTFTATIESFLKKTHRTWIDDQYNDSKGTEKPIKKGNLVEEWPSPNLEVIELSTGTDIRSFVRKFKVINSVEIRLVDTNHELDNSGLFTTLRSVKDDVGAKSLLIKTEKSGEIGLQKRQVVNLISGPIQDANSRVSLRGKDLVGDKLNGNNEHFKLAIPIRTLPSKVKVAANRAIDLLQKQIEMEIVTITKVGLNVKRKLQDIIRKMEKE